MQRPGYHDNYKTVIFDLKQFEDDFHVVASEIEKCRWPPKRSLTCFFTSAGAKTNMVVALVEERVSLLCVKNSLNGPPKMNYSSASQDMQLLKILHMKKIETIAEHSDNSVGKQIVIAIGGCCDRIGTTTQALQLVKYLQFMGHQGVLYSIQP